MRKTRTHTADPKAIEAILRIVQKRRKGLKKDGLSTTAEPLHMLVLGGSVPTGVGCYVNPLNLTLAKMRPCSWPTRLEHLFNEVFFQGDPVVTMTNMGGGGTSSWMGALVMEYQLFPDRNKIPHIIISSYAPNDYQQLDHFGGIFYSTLQNFIQLAKNVRPCEEDLPLVVIADHAYGDEKNQSVTDSQTLTGYYSVLAQWYDIMAFNHQNVARHELYANFNNKTATEQLVGGEYILHMGTGFHLGMAWVALFNFLEAIIDTCNDLGARTRIHETDEIPQHPSSGRIEDHLAATTPAVKQLSKLAKWGDGRNAEIVKVWKERVHENEQRCAAIRASHKNGENNERDADVLCPHVWMIGRGTGINTFPELKKFLNPFLLTKHDTKEDGWRAQGKPRENPRTGWYGRKNGAEFKMRIPLETAPARYITIISMKSFGPDWRESLFRLEVEIERNTPLELAPNANITMPIPEGTENATAIYHDQDKATFEIEGWHKQKVSVHYPFKFELPGHGAAEGDAVILKGILQGGKMFKIHGIAICRF